MMFDCVSQGISGEMRAAWGLFRWSEPVIVTRAPGRLDVMGGIADYSGSLVLQVRADVAKAVLASGV